MTLVVKEKLTAGLTREWKIQKVYAHEITPYQEVLIAQTEQGRTLFCNGERQSTELTQLIYHEAQIKSAIQFIGTRERALIIGSSEGVAPLMCAEEGFEIIDHVDCDLECVQLCAEHLPYGYTLADVRSHLHWEQLQHPSNPIRLHHTDGVGYVYGAQENSYDVVSMDLPDMSLEDEQQNRLYQAEFFQQIKRILKPGGVFITQAGCASLWRQSGLRTLAEQVGLVFKDVILFDSDEQDWCWVLGSDLSFAERDQYSVKFQCFDTPTLEKAMAAPFHVAQYLKKQGFQHTGAAP